VASASSPARPPIGCESGTSGCARASRRRGELNFNHNRLLKALFKGAATTVIAHAGPNPLRADYDRLCSNGTKPNLAKVTVA